MFKFLIKINNQQKQIYQFSTDIMIGRGEDVDIVFPDPSVSRHHAKVYIIGEEVIVEDLGSQNGVVVDGMKLPSGQRIPIKSKSEVQIGRFTLVLLTAAQDDQFYRGRSVSYLPEYNPASLQEPKQDDTLQLSAREATKLLREQNLLNNACIVDDTGRQYFPESNPLSFGKAAIVKVNGFMVGKVVANITWNGKQHILTKSGGFLITVKINDVNIQEQALNINDTIQIGSSIFKYILHSDK